MDVDGRKLPLDVAKQLLIPLERECGVQASLHEDLIAADGHHLLDLPKNHVAVEHVAFGMLRAAVKRAEVADRRADVCVVDVAVDVVGAIRLRMETPSDGVGSLADRGQRP